MTNLGDRIVVLIDMDCFFCQVEAKLNPSLKGKPLAVIQYSSFGPGSIIAVNYEARDFGVTRHMKGDEAKEKCPNIELVTVPPLRNKPDTGRYRTAGKEVIDVLKKSCAIIERASVDEAYLDITELVQRRMEDLDESPGELINHLGNTYVVGYCDDESNDEERRVEGMKTWLDQAFDDLGDYQARRLAVAGLIVEQMRADIYSQCEYRCSAGISYNKILAKLACGLHKPNKQTILPGSAVPALYSSLPVKKVRNLGGKFGNIVMESLNCNVMADLLKYSLHDLQRRFDEKTGAWLYNIARGIDTEAVVNRLVCKSIGASKNFPGKQAITRLEVLKKWANDLSLELIDRLEQDLEENERRATSLTISYQYYQDKKVVSQSRACNLPSYKVDKISDICVNIITKATQKPVAFIGMNASKFIPSKESGTFIKFFTTKTPKMNETVDKSEIVLENNETVNGSINKNDSILTDKLQNETGTVELNESAIKNETDKIETLDESISKSETSPSAKLKKLLETCRSPHKMKKPESPIVLKKKKVKKPTIIEVDLTESSQERKTNPPEEETDSSDERIESTGLDFNSTISEDKFKGSFFMNIFNDSRPSTSKANVNEKISVPAEKCNEIEEEQEDDGNQSSPDIFADVDSEPPKPVIQQNNEEDVDEEDEEEEETNGQENNAITQLKEIFPDLNNIDLSVVELLPIELQREARAYMKKSSSKSSESTSNPPPPPPNVSKNVKAKAKAKGGKGKKKKNTNTSIQTFFLKSNPDDSSKKQCPQCCQMIAIEKFAEHSDFHVAQSLHRSINQPVSTSKVISSPSSLKRKAEKKSPVSNKKIRSISSFFT